MASKKELRALITLAGKIDPSLSTALMKASGENAKFRQQLQQTNKEFDKGKKQGAKFGDMLKASFLGNLAAKSVATITSKVIELGKAGIQLASDLDETQNVIDITFGKSSVEIDAWAKTTLKSFGITELQSKQWSGSMGAMLKSSGIKDDDLAKISTDVAALAGDFASFYNLDHDEAWNKIRSGMSGETEPLKALGINMSVANLQAFAMSKGITKSYKDMDQAEQTLLRYNYLLEKSSDAQGDFSRTLEDSYENQKRLFLNTIQEKSAQLLAKSIPLLTAMYRKGNELLNKIDLSKISKGFNEISEYIQPLIPRVKEVIEHIKNIGVKSIPYIQRLVPVVLKLGQIIANFIIPVAKELWSRLEPAILRIASVVIPIIEKLGDTLSALEPVITWVTQVLISHFFNVIDALLPIGESIIDIFGGVLDFITGVFTGDWGKAIGGLVDVGKNILKGLGNILFTPFRTFLASINTVIAGVNKIKIPGIESLNIPPIPLPQFARGGIATGPSIFGEAGPEMAIPLRRDSRSLGLLSQTAQLLVYMEKGML